MSRAPGFRRVALCSLALLLPGTLPAQPPKAAEILSRFQETVAAEYRYRETRTLELMAEPWQGSGYLYSAPDGTMIKLQLEPERAIMAISGDRMIYYDDARDQRQSAPLASAGAMAEQVRSFRAILQGRVGELEKDYEIRAERSDSGWRLHLRGKAGPDGAKAPVIEIAENGGQREILIEQADGDQTRYTLAKSREGKLLDDPMKGLLSEALGE